jgi:replicative DNA helicase
LNPSRKTSRKPDSDASQALPTTLDGKALPASIEAEAAVLGSMILDRECIGQVVEQLDGDAFSMPEHRLLFESIVALYEANSKIDLVLLRADLVKRDRLKAAGGVDYLVRVAESVPTAANVEYYTRIVKERRCCGSWPGSARTFCGRPAMRRGMSAKNWTGPSSRFSP